MMILRTSKRVVVNYAQTKEKGDQNAFSSLNLPDVIAFQN